MSAFNLSALAVRERSVTLFLLVAIFVAGVVAFLTLGRAEDPSFTIKQMTVVTAWPGAKARGESHRRLVRDAETLRQRLLHVPGVKKVNIIGEQAERIFVEFSYDRLATLGVSPRDIFAALNSRNAMTPAGAIEAKGPQVLIRLDGAIDDLQKIRTTPVAAQGRTLKLADIAEVKRGYEDPATLLIRNNGEPTLLLGVVMREGW